MQRHTRNCVEQRERTTRVARPHGETELRVLLTGAYELVRVRLDAGRHANQTVDRGVQTRRARGVARSRQSCPPRFGARRVRRRDQFRPRICCCRAESLDSPARRFASRSRARHPSRRRCRDPLPPRGAPSHHRETTWTRRRRLRQRHWPPRDNGVAASPRRRRRAASRTTTRVRAVRRHR